MRTFRRICVFSGTTEGDQPIYRAAARDFGGFLARSGIAVVYGGGKLGLMGAVADGALAEGGEVVGVIPEKLRALEQGHEGLSELFVVDSMHARKAMMAHLSDAFVALPGGWGTLEEIFEVTTWTQLNYHKKPVGLLNVGGYYNQLLGFLDHAARVGFIRAVHRPLMQAADSPRELLKLLAEVEIPGLERWIQKP